MAGLARRAAEYVDAKTPAPREVERHTTAVPAFSVNAERRGRDVSGMLKNSFEQDAHPGGPRVLFVGLAESSHTHSWIDLLEGSGVNARLFAMPSGVPPRAWQVPTYVTAYDCPPLDPRTRARLYPANRAARFAHRNVRRLAGHGDPEQSAARWLAQVVRRWRPHVVHTLGLEPASYFYFDARRRFGLAGLGRWVVQARGGPELALHRLLPERAARISEVLAACDQFVADNRQNYEYALACGAREECLSPLGVVPGTGGVDVDALAARWAGPPSRRPLVLWPKAYECPQSKALPVFEALKLLGARAEAFEIHMLAATAETRLWFETLPEGLRRRSRLYERIPRAEALALMTRARVMLAPALSDGIPNSLYEAMAAGAFPIVSPLETIRPVVAPEENVLFARNLYPHEVAEALGRALADDQLVEGAAARNLALVRRLADRAEIGPRVAGFYERLARES